MCHNLLVFTRVPQPKIDNNDGVTETLKLGLDKKRDIVVYSYTLLMILGLMFWLALVFLRSWIHGKRLSD